MIRKEKERLSRVLVGLREATEGNLLRLRSAKFSGHTPACTSVPTQRGGDETNEVCSVLMKPGESMLTRIYEREVSEGCEGATGRRTLLVAHSAARHLPRFETAALDEL